MEHDDDFAWTCTDVEVKVNPSTSTSTSTSSTRTHSLAPAASPSPVAHVNSPSSSPSPDTLALPPLRRWSKRATTPLPRLVVGRGVYCHDFRRLPIVASCRSVRVSCPCIDTRLALCDINFRRLLPSPAVSRCLPMSSHVHNPSKLHIVFSPTPTP